MSMRRVNRIGLDGTSVTIAFGRAQIPCLTASYADGLEPQNLTYMGFQEISEQTEGTYKTENAKVKMSAVVFRADLFPLLQQDGFGRERLSVVVSESHPDLGDDSDLLDGARFVGISDAYENSSKAREVEFEISFTQLYRGNDRKTVNSLNLAVPLGSSNF
jgi:hypothetical protein